MSEENTEATQVSTETSSPNGEVKLPGLFAFKEGMATIHNENGEAVPVTVLRYEPWVVSQIKTPEKDGYSAVQLACRPKKMKNSSKSEMGHLKGAGMQSGAFFVRELRVDLPEGLSLGQKLSIDSLEKGQTVKLMGRSKGKGFQGSQRRWNTAGGPASHGSKFHRSPGSSGNRTWPGRVMPGKKFPGHLGDEMLTLKNVEIVEVLPEENVLMVKGPVPGSRDSLVKLVKD